MSIRRSTENKHKLDRWTSKMVPLLFAAFLGLAVIQPFIFSLFGWGSFQGCQFYLVGLSVVLGVVVFWWNRDRFSDSLERISSREVRGRIELGRKLRRIGRIAGVGWLIRWMSREGWGYSAGLILVLLVGALLRFWDLGGTGFQVDEIFHAVSADSVTKGGLPYQCVEDYTYWRGALVTYGSAVLEFIFGKSEFWLRVPMALSGMLLILISYLLGRTFFNRNVGLIFASFIAFDIWFVEFSRYLRFYAPLLALYALALWVSFKYFTSKNPVHFACLLILMILASLLADIHSVVVNFLIVVAFLTWYAGERIGRKRVYRLAVKHIVCVLVAALSSYVVLKCISWVDPSMERRSELDTRQSLETIEVFLGYLADNYSLVIILGFVTIAAFLYMSFLAIRRRKEVPVSDNAILVGILTTVVLANVGVLVLASLTNFNFTVRPLLFMVFNLSFVVSIGLYCLITSFGSPLRACMLVILTIVLCGLLAESMLFLPSQYGDSFHPHKMIYDKQPIVLDAKTTALWAREFMAHHEDKDFFVITVALNPLHDYYYMGRVPDAFVRWDSALKDEEGRIPQGIKLYSSKEELTLLISASIQQGKSVLLVAQATIYPIENQFHRRYRGYPYPLEAPPEIYMVLERNNGDVVYWGEDGVSRVYLFEADDNP